MMPSGAVIVARQAGTAAAFAPLLLESIGLSSVRTSALHVFAYPSAAPIFQRLGVTSVTVDDFDAASAALDELSCPLLLTGTSLDVDDDSRWWRWAREHGVPSVAFVDQWCNYAERFTLDSALLAPDALPDRIAAVDVLAARRLAEAGLPGDRIVVTGTPLTDTWVPANATATAATRETLAGLRNPWLVLYVCEPDPGHWVDRALLADADYDRRIAALADAAGALAAETSRAVHLAIKPHPIQRQRGFLPPLPPAIDGVTASVEDGDPRALVRAADVVVGHQSMLLHEAAAAGAAVLALLGADEPVPDLVRATPGLRVCRPADLRSGLIAASRDCAPRAGDGLPGQATARFLAALGIAEGHA